MTPADSRYLRNVSFFCSVACGGHAREELYVNQSSGASGREETERHRESKDAAREDERLVSRNAASTRSARPRKHFSTLTDRTSRRDAGRDARARAHERVFNETRRPRTVHAWCRSVERAQGFRPCARARCRSLSETASRRSSGFARTREAPWTPRRVQTRPTETTAGCVPYRTRSDRRSRSGRASSARA